MEPKTTSVEGEKALVQAGKEVNVNVGFQSGQGRGPVKTQTQVLLPQDGGEFAAPMASGIGAVLIVGGVVLASIAARMRSRRK